MISLKIDRNLSQVMPLENDIYVVALPLPRMVIDGAYLELAGTLAELGDKGLLALGAQVSGRVFRSVCTANGKDPTTFLSAVHQRCTVVAPVSGEYVEKPLVLAVREGVIDVDDLEYLESFLVFSTAVSFCATKAAAVYLLNASRSMSSVSTTSLGTTEYIATLPTLITTDSSVTNTPNP